MARWQNLIVLPVALFVARSSLAAESFLPPPRTVSDVTELLDRQAPPADLASKLAKSADAGPPAGASRADLARFYLKRSHSRHELGDAKGAIEDADKSVELGRGVIPLAEYGFMLQAAMVERSFAGEPKAALRAAERFAQQVNQPGAQGFLFFVYFQMVNFNLQLGDFDRADAIARRQQALLQQARNWPRYAARGVSWEGSVERTRVALFMARGQYEQVLTSAKRAEDLSRRMLREMQNWENAPEADLVNSVIDQQISIQGFAKMRLGRVAEGEADVRRALLNRLKAGGKYNLSTVGFVRGLGQVLAEQGRYPEAETLFKETLAILDAIGVDKHAQPYAQVLGLIGNVQNLQGRWQEAQATFALQDDATSTWDANRRDAMMLAPGPISVLYSSNDVTAGLEASRRNLARQVQRFGEQSQSAALARGMVAMGLMMSGRPDEALAELRKAAPALLDTRTSDRDDSLGKGATEQRLQRVADTYFSALARSPNAEAAEEGFRIAESVRGRAVQRALAAAGARSANGNPQLASVVRKQQDLELQITAQYGELNNVLGAAPEQRDDKYVKDLQAQIAKLQTERDALSKSVSAKFRNYGDLVNPKPPEVRDIKAVLGADEVFLSYYFAQKRGYAWVIRKDGPPVFAPIPIGLNDLAEKVAQVRRSLETQASTIIEMEPFDAVAAYDLYTLLLKPIEASWKDAKHLVVATNGALGLLPLSLLPTEPPGDLADDGALFSRYRKVAWLARTHAVTVVPSAASLRSLRQAGAGSASRQKLIGFGDPVFSNAGASEEAAQEEAFVTADLTAPDLESILRGRPLKRRAAPNTRGVDSADIRALPPLPDTAEELRAIAKAMNVDASNLHLGLDANEQTVRKANLANYRVIAFATHGLVPGDLNGLVQPALALTPPPSRSDGDGLLTMDEILTLKVDADWVVLSACNTAAGIEAGAEANSGLARAFFYAGARSILVTNWSVHSASARDLVSELFRRQAEASKIDRDEALRQAMLAVMDGPGARSSSGETLYTYAHPLFWAPYSIIGEARNRDR